MKHANYRKNNNGEHCSSTFHKKDGTPVRVILKREAKEEETEVVECYACSGTGWRKEMCQGELEWDHCHACFGDGKIVQKIGVDCD